MSKVEFKPRRLGHVNLYVSDLERSMAFYESVCGLARVRMESEINAGFLSNGNTHHDVGLIEVSRGQDRYGRDGHVQISSTRGTQPGLNHLGWEMENQAALVAAYARMKSAGVAPHALYDHIISTAVYISDPDGNIHEFYADTMKDWGSVFNLEHDNLVTSKWDPLGAVPITEANYNLEPELRRHSDDEVPVHHVTGTTLATHQYEKMMGFMLDIAGFQLLEERNHDGRRTAVFGGTTGRRDLVVTEVADEQPAGFQLISLVVSQTAQARQQLESLDAPHVLEHLDHQDRTSVVLADPDGFKVELYAPRHAPYLEPIVPAARSTPA